MHGAASETTTPDGLDNDCDGYADEGTTDCSAATIKISDSYSGNPGVPNGSYEYDIFVYEASRYNADSGSAGTYSTVACSMQNHIPWTYITYSEAREACWVLNSSGQYASGGWDLCSAWQWQNACERGPASNQPFSVNYGLAYPYGDTYQSTYCNGYDSADSNLTPTRDAYGNCVSDWTATPASQDDGLYDMSGNAEEWTLTRRIIGSGDNVQGLYQIRGGSFNDLGQGMTCDFDFWAAADDEDFFMENLGYRCCKGDQCQVDEDCGDGYQCNTGGTTNSCEACDNATNCGPDCTPCSAPYYTCLGAVEGCFYCNTSSMCGATCSPCGGEDICWDSGSGPACTSAPTCASRLAFYNFDFEDSSGTSCDNDGWSVTGDWSTGVPTTGGTPDGSLCVLATIPGGLYSANQPQVTATSPSIGLSVCQAMNVDLIFDMWNYIEDGAPTDCFYDHAWLEVSGNGTYWTAIDTTCAYDDTTDQQWCRDQSFSSWNLNCTADVSSYMGGGGDFQVRFVFYSDPGAERDGIYVDNVHLEFQ